MTSDWLVAMLSANQKAGLNILVNILDLYMNF